MVIDPIADFKSNISPFMGDWNSIHLRAIALPSDIGLQLYSMRIVLSQERKADLPSKVTEIGEVVLIEDAYDLDKLDVVLKMIAEGEVIGCGRTVHLKKKEGEKWPVIRVYSCNFYDRETSRDMSGIDNACFALDTYDSTPRSQIDTKRWEGALMTADTPYDGLADLKEHFLGQSRGSGYGAQEMHLEVLAVLGVKFLPDSHIDEHAVQLNIEMKRNTDPAAIAVATVARGKKGTERRRSTISANGRLAKDARISQSISVDRPVEWIKCMLLYHSMEADRIELLSEDIVAENPRWQVFSEVTGGTEALKEVPVGRHLEAHVEVLLHLLGFSTAHYGGRDWPTHKAPPDIVAFPDHQKWFLVLECTERDADINNKLTRLSTRTKELSRATPMLKAYPVLVTALDRAMINKTDEEKAEKEQIAILSKDDLMNLQRAVLEGKTPAEVKSVFVKAYTLYSFGIR